MNIRIRVSRYALGFLLLAATVALLSSALVRRSAVAAPWDLVSFKHVDADPNNSYPVSDSAGPWMIMVTTFHGENAESQAQRLVYELRKQYKLKAYSHSRRYDYNQKHMPGRGVTRDGSPMIMRYMHEESYEEVAVLVGDFHAVDDPDAQKELAQIKRADPQCLKPDAAPTAWSPVADVRRWGQQTFGIGKKTNGPLANAFITTNPLLPREYFVGRGVDKFVLEINKGVDHSLLDCPGRYSVRIATFRGRVVIDQDKIRQLEADPDRDQADGSPLVEAAAKAHAITEYLRARNVEAYEFHDRTSSIVTVGHFNSVGTPRDDGKIEINPAIYQIIKDYGADQSSLTPGAMSLGVRPKTVDVRVGKSNSIVLDITPVPIEVPHRTVSGMYQASMSRW